MKIESPSFTQSDLQGFLDETRETERLHLVGRLETLDARLDALAPRLEAEPVDARHGDGWTAHEVLAHMAVLSKFYGVVAYQIGSGKATEFNLPEFVSLRDVVGEQAAQEPVAELLQQVRESHEKTLGWLRRATAADLERRATTGMDRDPEMTAGEVVRLVLCAHLEQHLDQLEEALR